MQYSARLIIKEKKNFGSVLEDLSLYNMSLHKRKAPHDTNVNTSNNDGGAQSYGAVSEYKVKNLIHSSQEIDQKI